MIPKSNIDAMLVSHENLPQLMEEIPISLPSLAYIHFSVAFELRHSVGFQFIVDRWPGFRIVLLYNHNVCKATFGPEIRATCCLGVKEAQFATGNGKGASEGLESGTYLHQFLSLVRTKFGFHSHVMFAAIDSDIQVPVNHFFVHIIEENFICNKFHPCTEMKLFPANLITPDLTILEDKRYNLDSLKIEEAMQVNREWTFGTQNTIGLVQMQIENCCTVALRWQDDDRDELIGFALQQYYGAYGMLFIKPQHRGKGLAKIIIYTLTNKIFQSQGIVFCYIIKDNLASEKLHLKLGFQVEEGSCGWMILHQ